MTIEVINGTLTAYMLRHGEKNPSTATVRPNQLTDDGIKQAHKFGISLHEKAPNGIDAFCSTEDRSEHTAWYINAGLHSRNLDDAIKLFQDKDSDEYRLYAPIVEPRLAQKIVKRIVNEYRAGLMTRAESIEQCYAMLSTHTPLVQGREVEREMHLDGALAYIQTALEYVTPRKEADSKRPTIAVFVGHDPNIGCLMQLLSPSKKLREVPPLQGLKFQYRPLSSRSDLEGTEITPARTVYGFTTEKDRMVMGSGIIDDPTFRVIVRSYVHS